MDTATLRKNLEDRLGVVERRITDACRRAGRHRSEVTLVAVTKTVSPEIAGLLPELGLLDLGENRPQELWRKASSLGPDIRWHMIGHLQRNKIDKTVPIATMIHAVDSVRLLEALDHEAARQERDVDVLLEVNASGEAAKHGFAPTDLPGLVEPLRGLRRVHVLGLMTMAALQEPEACRPTFEHLRRLRDELRDAVAPSHDIQHLSMGMSNDFEVAIEEGATLVRLGSVLFEGLK